MTSRRTMVREDGTTFWPSYVPADEVLVAYLKMSVEYFSGRSNKKIR